MHLPMPVRHAFSSTAPRVAGDPFHQFHEDAYLTMVGRRPSAFERATAASLKDAFYRMSTTTPSSAFTALSSPTGSGKTTSACVLMAYLAMSEGATCAYVVPTIAVAEEVLTHLTKLLPAEVACYTSVHKANASPRAVDQYAEQGVVPSAHFTEDQLKAARLVVVTHERWRHELGTGHDLGVLNCNGKDRDLVVVDEEPDLAFTVVRQPEDVSALASLLADADLRGDARTIGFTEDHHAASTLLDIHNRMRAVKDNAAGSFLRSADIVTAEDLQQLAGVTSAELAARIAALSLPDLTDSLAYFSGTLEFLKLAAQGRVFYSREESGAFFAYGFPVTPQRRHLILDGTADINGMYAVGSHVSVVQSVAANYSRVRLHAVKPPKQFRDRMRNSGILRNDGEVYDYLAWFMPFLVANTTPGQSVLVYAKKRMLEYGAHKLPEFDDSGDRKARYVTTLAGRTIHWCSFGRGRGLNAWKQCTAYFRLGDFVLKKSALLAQIAATTGEAYSPAELRSLNSGTLRDARLDQAKAAHLATTNKQDAARICIRHLDDDGQATAADLWMVDCDLATLESYRERMFPGASEYTVHRCYEEGAKESQRSPRDGAASRVADLLLTTDLHRLTVTELSERGEMLPQHYARTLTTSTVREAMTARGWREVTRKDLGMSGKGKLLVRDALTILAV